MTAKVAETVGKLTLAPEDVALAALAVEYARTIDRAAAIAADAAKVEVTEETADVLDALRKRVAAHAAVSDLGPKLLAALTALGATPRARAAVGKPAPPAGPSRLAALRNDPAGA